jgi:acyl carrier protein
VTKDEFQQVLIRILGIENTGRLSDDLPIEDLPNLDSLRFMQLINTFEAEAGIILTPEDLMDVETVGELFGLVSGAARVV